mgnify:CR=1 FL=1
MTIGHSNIFIKHCLLIKYKWMDITFAIVILLCFWVVLAVGLDCKFLKIPCNYDSKTISNINTILLNLSYSYIAGCIFYFLSVTLPRYKARRTIRKGINIKMQSIQKALNDILQCFAEGTKLSAKDCSKKNIQNIFTGKGWNDIDKESELFGYNRTTMQACCLHNQYILREIDALITTYKEYLNAEVLSLLEELRNSRFIINTAIYSHCKSSSTSVKEGLADEYINMLNLYKKISELI